MVVEVVSGGGRRLVNAVAYARCGQATGKDEKGECVWVVVNERSRVSIRGRWLSEWDYMNTRSAEIQAKV